MNPVRNTRMKALFYNFPQKKFILKEVSLPKIKSAEVLVKVKASALCGTDLHIIKGPLTLKAYNKKEIILGHSFSGVVFEAGKLVKNFKKGNRVFVANFVWCGKCQRCREGNENLCDHRFIFGMEAPGSHAEYISVPQRALFHLPGNINFEEASIITDTLSLVLHAFKKSGAKPSNKILILGAGPVGLTLGILLRFFKMKSIFVIEPVRHRQNLVKKLFNPKIISEEDLRNFENQFDIIFEASGNLKALELGYKLLKRGGKMVMIGIQGKNFNLNTLKWISRELSLLGIFDFTIRDIKESLKLITQGKVNLKKIITHQFLLAEGDRAYRLLKSKKAGRIVLLP